MIRGASTYQSLGCVTVLASVIELERSLIVMNCSFLKGTTNLLGCLSRIFDFVLSQKAGKLKKPTISSPPDVLSTDPIIAF